MTVKQYPAGSRACPVKDCLNPAPPAIPMCKAHWQATPAHLRRQIERTIHCRHGVGRRVTKHATYEQAMHQAVLALAAKDMLNGRK